ncbi:MAG: TetR/AcrR family transcriptional regulator [Paracoccaceae bacterium]|jgi:TetR/AcrR family transcriptional regulator, mexJK operon transcriptional repressor|nr:TetR/AcrR family transcriptional regulator [Paracoccaceae bacterium]
MTEIKPVLKKGRKFDQVLDAARGIFMAEGFEGANMDEIALAARVSKATVYSYFPDKSLLFIESAKAEIARITQEAENVAFNDAPIETVLRFTAHTIVDFYMSTLGQSLFRVCVSESDRFPELGKTFYEAGPRMGRDRMSGYFEHMVGSGVLAIEDTKLAADQFSELCRADLFPRVAFGLADTITSAEIERVIDGAIETFMARYGAKN